MQLKLSSKREERLRRWNYLYRSALIIITLGYLLPWFCSTHWGSSCPSLFGFVWSYLPGRGFYNIGEFLLRASTLFWIQPILLIWMEIYRPLLAQKWRLPITFLICFTCLLAVIDTLFLVRHINCHEALTSSWTTQVLLKFFPYAELCGGGITQSTEVAFGTWLSLGGGVLLVFVALAGLGQMKNE